MDSAFDICTWESGLSHNEWYRRPRVNVEAPFTILTSQYYCETALIAWKTWLTFRFIGLTIWTHKQWVVFRSIINCSYQVCNCFKSSSFFKLIIIFICNDVSVVCLNYSGFVGTGLWPSMEYRCELLHLRFLSYQVLAAWHKKSYGWELLTNWRSDISLYRWYDASMYYYWTRSSEFHLEWYILHLLSRLEIFI